MPLITLVRHGQASFGAADYDHLSELGHRQSTLAGEVLAGRGLRDPLLCRGTLARQRDTLTRIAEAMGLPDDPQVDAGWNEYDHVALAERHARAAGEVTPGDARGFQMVLDRALAEWIRTDDEEGWRAFADGARRALGELVDGLDGRDAIVATSGGIIATIVTDLLGGGADTVVALNRVVVNAAFTTLLVGRQGVNLLAFNDHAHLTGPGAAMRTYR